MTYLGKLVRRAAGRRLKHTLRPQLSRWKEVDDPFENTAVLPLTYPVADKQEGSTPPAERSTPAKSSHADATPQAVKPSVSIPPPSQEKRVQPMDVADTAAPASPVDHPPSGIMHDDLDGAVEGSPLIRRTSLAKAKNDRSMPGKMGGVGDQPYRSVSAEQGAAPASRRVKGPFREISSRDDTGAEQASVTPQVDRQEVVLPLRRKARLQTKDTLRVVIGRMTVNVVPVNPPAVPTGEQRPTRKIRQRRRSAGSSRLAQKLGYGLGQM